MADDAADDDDLADGISQPAMDGALRDYAAWFSDAKAPALPARLRACLDAAIAAARLDDAAAQGAMAVLATLNFLMCLAEYMPPLAPGPKDLPQNIFFQISNLVTAYAIPPEPLAPGADLTHGPTLNFFTRSKAAKRRQLALLDKRAEAVARASVAAAVACVTGFIARHRAMAAAASFTPDVHLRSGGPIDFSGGEGRNIRKTDALWREGFILSSAYVSGLLGAQLLALSSRRCEATGGEIEEDYLAAFFIRFTPTQKRDLVNRTLWPEAIHMVAASEAENIRQLRLEDAGKLDKVTTRMKPDGGFWRRYWARSSGLF
jgi:hypothetical protein